MSRFTAKTTTDSSSQARSGELDGDTRSTVSPTGRLAAPAPLVPVITHLPILATLTAGPESRITAVLDPPVGLADDTVLNAVRAGWPHTEGCDSISYLPVGFGAHHWRVDRAGAPQLFATMDKFAGRHTPASLEDAYLSAAALHLDVVAAPTPTRTGTYTQPLDGGALSCTLWLNGITAGPGPITDPALAAANITALSELHAAAWPTRIPTWQPPVRNNFADLLADLVDRPWETGPLGDQARNATAARIEQVVVWVQRYHQLGAAARERRWVPTHGEPHTRNQMITSGGLRLVDWESLRLAPRERDLGPLLDAGYAHDLHPDWAMVEMFDLEWRLDEIDQYTRWLSQPHSGTDGDHAALGGLIEELTRPPRTTPT